MDRWWFILRSTSRFMVFPCFSPHFEAGFPRVPPQICKSSHKWVPQLPLRGRSRTRSAAVGLGPAGWGWTRLPARKVAGPPTGWVEETQWPSGDENILETSPKSLVDGWLRLVVISYLVKFLGDYDHQWESSLYRPTNMRTRLGFWTLFIFDVPMGWSKLVIFWRI